MHLRYELLLRPHMCLCVKHKHKWPEQTHAHSESAIFCTNPISGAIHGALRGVVHAACNACACKQANRHHAMHISCTCTHPTSRCASAALVLRSSWRLRLLAAKKKIGLTCKPGQEPRAAQAGLRCHLRLERSPFTAAPEAKASSCKLPTKEQACDDEASCH